MKKILFVALSTVLFSSSCKKEENNNAPDLTKARVMFMHATLSADTLRIKTNNDVQGNLTALGILNYKELFAGSTTVSFVFPQTNFTLKDTTLNLLANNFYSIFSAGAVNSPDVFITNDDLSNPPSGSAKVRFVNLSLSNLNEIFYVGNNALDSNVSYKMVTPFRTITAGAHNVLIQDPAQPTVIKQLLGHQFVAGKIYTIVLTGMIGGAGNAELKLTVINNN